MTLRLRIVVALVLAALVPMAVVLVVPLLSAKRRADDETTARIAAARRQAEVLLERERALLTGGATHAADDLAADRDGLPAVLRGPESLAVPVARRLAERYGLDRVSISGEAGGVLAVYERGSGAVSLVEDRRIGVVGETLLLHAERDLGPEFLALVEAVTAQRARISHDPSDCGPSRAEVAVSGGAILCVGVPASTAGEVRADLLKAFVGTAPMALLLALAVGLYLSARIVRPLRALTDRADEISARHAGPLTLLPERDEILRLTLAFERMLDGLAASERQRAAAERVAAWEEIARRLAHEIKNPLSPIQLAVENLRRVRERAPGELDRALAEETATILEEVAVLRRLVDEFARFARLPRPIAAPCDPRAIVASALALYAARIDSSRVAVTVIDREAPTTVVWDAEQVGRAVKNVIQNALDAMEGCASRALRLEVRESRDRRGIVEIAVEDSGPGFTPEVRRRVFEPYFTTRGEAGGTGLGLAIAYRIAADHGGSIRADRGASGGARVEISLPAGGPPTA